MQKLWLRAWWKDKCLSPALLAIAEPLAVIVKNENNHKR